MIPKIQTRTIPRELKHQIPIDYSTNAISTAYREIFPHIANLDGILTTYCTEYSCQFLLKKEINSYSKATAILLIAIKHEDDNTSKPIATKYIIRNPQEVYTTCHSMEEAISLFIKESTEVEF